MIIARHSVLLVILLTAMVGSVAAQGAPKRDVTEQKKGLDTKETKLSDKVLPPVGEQPRVRASDTQTAKSSEDIEIQGKLVKFTKWLVIVGALQFLALIVQAFAFWYTLDAVRTQANLMRVHAEHLENLVAAAKANSEAARDSVEMLISKERARIRIEVGRLEIRRPDDVFPYPEVSYKVFCYGTTPAFPLDSRATLIITDSQEPANKAFPIPMSFPSVINPAAEGIQKSALLFDTLQENASDRIRKGELFPHFFGSIKYRDVFDREREYRFRYIWKLSSWLALTIPTPGTEPPKLEDLGSWYKCGAANDNSET